MATRRDGVLFPRECEAFALETPEAFLKACGAAIEALKAAASSEAASAVYAERVLPREVERIRRAAVGRGAPAHDLLFVTVGRQAESPLLATLATPADFVVFLHTDSEVDKAEEVIGRLELDASEAGLESVGDGKDPLVIYRCILRAWRDRGEPERVGVDLTGGFKTMSAAAASAAFALPGAGAYYIDADQPRVHGKAYWINERRLAMRNPLVVFGELERREALTLLGEGHYVAAEKKFEVLSRELGEDSRPDRCRALLAGAYAAIEALDFGLAVQRLEELERRLREWAHDPSVGRLAHLARSVSANLGGARALEFVVKTPSKDAPNSGLRVLQADEYRDFVAYLIASAKRHHVQGALDVGALLAYRALESICQRRIAIRGGSDPGAFDWAVFARAAGISEEDLVAAYNQTSGKREHHVEAGRLPAQVARTVAFTLLRAAFPGDIASEMAPAKFGGLGDSRNRSILSHGFQKLSGEAAQKLIDGADAFFERMLEIEELSVEQRRQLRARHAFFGSERAAQ